MNVIDPLEHTDGFHRAMALLNDPKFDQTPVAIARLYRKMMASAAADPYCKLNLDVADVVIAELALNLKPAEA